MLLNVELLAFVHFIRIISIHTILDKLTYWLITLYLVIIHSFGPIWFESNNSCDSIYHAILISTKISQSWKKKNLWPKSDSLQMFTYNFFLTVYGFISLFEMIANIFSKNHHYHVKSMESENIFWLHDIYLLYTCLCLNLAPLNQTHKKTKSFVW